MMHFITRKVEGLEARQGPVEPEPELEDIDLAQVEERVTVVEKRVDELDQLLADYEKGDEALGAR